jgi:hypothetical protein
VVEKVMRYFPPKVEIDGVMPAVHAPPEGKAMVLAVVASWVKTHVRVTSPLGGTLLIATDVMFSVRVVVKALPVERSSVIAPAELVAEVEVSAQSFSLGCWSSLLAMSITAARVSATSI